MSTEITPMRRGHLKLLMLEPIASTLAHLPRLVAVGADVHPAGVAADDEELEGEPRLDWSCLSTEYAVLDDELYEVAGPVASMLRRREEDSGSSASGSSALVIHDGSASRIAPFIAEHFSSTLVVGAGAEIANLVERLAPAAMIEIVEESTLLHD
jgi:hypothetical protein